MIGETFGLKGREVGVDVLEEHFEVFDYAFDISAGYFLTEWCNAKVFGHQCEVFGSFHVSFEEL